MNAVHLQTEYLTEPLGIDVRVPRFYWNCEGGLRQSAYRITASTDGRVIWDSGKVASPAMTHVPYGGPALKSRQRVEWSVQLWDERDVPGACETSVFEMGLLDARDWKAKWISGDYSPRKNERYPVDYFRREFGMPGEIARARLYITACGLYRAFLNGKSVGASEGGEIAFAPGCTDYRKRLQYQVYDVTELLERRNCLTLELADGWFRGSVGCYGPTSVYGRQTGILCQLEMIFKNGRKVRISSDEKFSWSNDGPVRFNDMKDGEVYDAGCTPSYDGQARVVKNERSLVASNNVPCREKERFSAALITTPSGKKVLDFGQNIAGFVAFSVKGKKGQELKLTLGEKLDENGEFTQKNMQVKKPAKEFGKTKSFVLMVGLGEKLIKDLQVTPKQEVRFICSGGEDRYKTSYALFGFRYALIETDVDFSPENFQAIAVYSDLEQTGSFRCSDERVNQLVCNTVWSMKGNFLDIPTDCPTRERMGWTGDSQIFFDTGAYMMNLAPFYRKWMQDLEDGKMKNGVVPAVVPYCAMDMMYSGSGASAGWGDSAVLIPYRYWKRYGDKRALKQFYPLVKSYCEYEIAHTGHTDKKTAKADPLNRFVYEKGMHLGEWLEPEEFNDPVVPFGMPKQTEVATAYLHYSMRIAAEIARELGEAEDERRWLEYASGSRKAYYAMFLAEGAPDTDRQAKLVRPLALGLVDDACGDSGIEGIAELKEALRRSLAQSVVNREYRVGTGFLSTPFLLPMLTEAGEKELAYKMLLNETPPGWLAEIREGATTVWEDWEGNASQNHYSPGAVCQWLYESVVGIRLAGENCFTIAPIPGGGLTFAEGEYLSPYGTVKSRWEKAGEQTRFSFEIPANTSAVILLPDGSEYAVGAGNYEYTA